MKLFQITHKYLLEIFREWQLVLMILLLPIVFLFITYFTYPGTLIQTYPLHIRIHPEMTTQSQGILENLQQTRYANGQLIYEVDQAILSEEEIDSHVQNHDFVLAMDLNTQTDPATLNILGDPLYGPYYQAVNALQPQKLGITTPQKITARITPLYTSGPLTNFEVYAPGMIVFAILLMIMQTSMLVTREIKSGTIRRYQLSGTPSAAIVGGITLAQILIAFLQILVIGGISMALGFKLHGSIAFAVLNALILALSAIGQGLIIGCFLENDTQSATIGATAAMLQVFVSGAFFEMPSFSLFHIGEHRFNLFDLLPATHSMQLFNLSLSYGAQWPGFSYHFLVMCFLTILLFIVAGFIFQKRCLQA